MPVIKQDTKGIYAWVGGYVSRPKTFTKFNVGDKVAGKHFGGSGKAGMGKLPGRGQYEEIWNNNLPIRATDFDIGSLVEIAYPRKKVTVKSVRVTKQDFMGFEYNDVLVVLPDGSEEWHPIYKIVLIHKK